MNAFPNMAYVVGGGRSGSTLLDIILGSHSNMSSFGELCNLARLGWIKNEYCACGRHVLDCDFWQEVRTLWLRKTGDGNVQEYADLQRRYESGRWFMGLRTRRWTRAADFRKYLSWTRDLLEILSGITGANTIVDSSKGPARAFSLLKASEQGIFLIHLVRDPRAVAWAVRQPFAANPEAGVQCDVPGRPVLRTVLSLVRVNLAAERLCRQVSARAIRIRYEDLASDPVDTLQHIGALVGEDFTDVAHALAAGRPIETDRHTVAGNRLRMLSSITLRYDDRWIREMPAAARLMVSVTTWPLLRRYGYL